MSPLMRPRRPDRTWTAASTTSHRWRVTPVLCEQVHQGRLLAPPNRRSGSVAGPDRPPLRSPPGSRPSCRYPWSTDCGRLSHDPAPILVRAPPRRPGNGCPQRLAHSRIATPNAGAAAIATRPHRHIVASATMPCRGAATEVRSPRNRSRRATTRTGSGNGSRQLCRLLVGGDTPGSVVVSRSLGTSRRVGGPYAIPYGRLHLTSSSANWPVVKRHRWAVCDRAITDEAVRARGATRRCRGRR